MQVIFTIPKEILEKLESDYGREGGRFNWSSDDSKINKVADFVDNIETKSIDEVLLELINKMGSKEYSHLTSSDEYTFVRDIIRTSDDAYTFYDEEKKIFAGSREDGWTEYEVYGVSTDAGNTEVIAIYRDESHGPEVRGWVSVVGYNGTRGRASELVSRLLKESIEMGYNELSEASDIRAYETDAPEGTLLPYETRRDYESRKIEESSDFRRQVIQNYLNYLATSNLVAIDATNAHKHVPTYMHLHGETAEKAKSWCKSLDIDYDILKDKLTGIYVCEYGHIDALKALNYEYMYSSILAGSSNFNYPWLNMVLTKLQMVCTMRAIGHI